MRADGFIVWFRVVWRMMTALRQGIGPRHVRSRWMMGQAPGPTPNHSHGAGCAAHPADSPCRLAQHHARGSTGRSRQSRWCTNPSRHRRVKCATNYRVLLLLTVPKVRAPAMPRHHCRRPGRRRTTTMPSRVHRDGGRPIRRCCARKPGCTRAFSSRWRTIPCTAGGPIRAHGGGWTGRSRSDAPADGVRHPWPDSVDGG